MLGDTVDRHDVRKVDLGRGLVGELDLSLLRGLFQPLESHRILLEVDPTVLGGELGGQPVDNLLVEVITTQVSVTIRGLDLEHTATQLKDGDIEGTATKVVDSDLHVLVLLVKAISKSGGCRLINDPLDIETGDLASLFGGLTL